MKVLHIFPYLPTPSTFGGATRIYHILRQISKYHDVTVAGFNNHGNLRFFKKEFPELVGKMHFIGRKHSTYRQLLQFYSYFTSRMESRKLELKLNKLLAKNDFDIVLTEFISMAHFDLRTNAVKILDVHNVDFYNKTNNLKRAGIREKFYKRDLEEMKFFKRYDAIFVVSGRDGAIIKRDAPEATQFVVPNGADTGYFRSSGVSPEPFSMVFTGAMGEKSNSDGMIYFLKEIFPIIKRFIPKARIYIVGSNPPSELLKYQSNSVVITGFVDDVRPYIDQASVYVVPLKSGGGSRFKVVEALSMQKPVVSTTVGCEGINVVNNKHLIIQDNPEAFAKSVIGLFNDQNHADELAAKGHDLVKRQYDWNVIGKSVDEFFKILTKQRLAV